MMDDGGRKTVALRVAVKTGGLLLVGALCSMVWTLTATPLLAAVQHGPAAAAAAAGASSRVLQQELQAQPQPQQQQQPPPPADEMAAFFEGCRSIYLDVGSNVGIQIRKLFEPALFPGAPAVGVFDEVFGPDRGDRTDVCAVGFEANVHHTPRLKALERAYNAQGWRVRLLTDTAVSTEDGTAEFFFDTVALPEQHEWGASLIPWQRSMERGQGSTVRTLDLARFVLQYLAPSSSPSSSSSLLPATPGPEEDPATAVVAPRKVVMKMDIEGSEHTVMPHMIVTGALCHVDVVFAEYHAVGRLVSAANVTDRHFADFFAEFVAEHDPRACKTRFRDLDDETYGASDFPLPGEAEVEAQAEVEGLQEEQPSEEQQQQQLEEGRERRLRGG